MNLLDALFGRHTIKKDSTSYTSRASLQFTGAGVTVTDDSAGDQTVVAVTGGSGEVEGANPSSSYVITSIASLGQLTFDFTAGLSPFVELGDFILVSSTQHLEGLVLTAEARGSDVVRIYLSNPTGSPIALSSPITFKASIIRQSV